MSRSPALPWEVIERVIDHSAKKIGTLYSFTLTCRDLRPRSTILLLERVKPRTRNQLFDLCALLQTKPHLLPCVRSISISVHEFSPHPLLRIFPNLSEIEVFAEISLWDKARPVTFHASVLTHCRQFGQHIRTLSLRDLVFPSLSAFSDILLSLPSIESLSCESLHIKNSNEHVHQELIARRLSERLHLRTLTIDGNVEKTPVTLLMDVAKQTLVALTFTTAVHQFGKPLLGSPSNWVQLNSLTWRIPDMSDYEESIQYILEVLENFHPPRLQEITIRFHFYSFRHLLIEELPGVSKLCTTLEKTLITFPQPTISFACGKPFNRRRYHLWIPMLHRLFPALADRHGLKIDAKFWDAGHDGKIQTPIVISADSRWAATGSSDGTIIIWDLQTGCISQEWFAEDYGVDSLAFSPDSRYIMSSSSRGAARGKGPTIWDLQGARRVNSLTVPEQSYGQIRYDGVRCAWSPDGSWIAAGPTWRDGTIHVWETATFQRLHFPSTALKGALLAFSPNGRRVVTAVQGPPHGCWIWDMESGMLHRSLLGHADRVNAAAFNMGGSRVVTGSNDSTIRVWHTTTGHQLLILKEQATRRVHAVAFSGDGRMVLSHSSRMAKHLNDESLMDDGSGRVKVWDTSNGALLACLLGPPTYVYSLPSAAACFSPCGSYVATASIASGATLLWRTSDWSCIAKVSGDGAPVTQVAISPDGRVLCWGTTYGTVFFRRIHDLVSANQD